MLTQIPQDNLGSQQIVLSAELAQAIQPQFTNQPRLDAVANAKVFELLWPRLYGRSEKKQQPLQKVDYYMLEETQELIVRLKRFCAQLQISPATEFRISRDGQALAVIGDFAAKDELCRLINADRWFVGSFIWLQPNYANLAHSFEVLEFSECYEQSPKMATERFAHFIQEDKGLSFALLHINGMAQAQVETPLNLYCIQG